MAGVTEAFADPADADADADATADADADADADEPQTKRGLGYKVSSAVLWVFKILLAPFGIADKRVLFVARNVGMALVLLALGSNMAPSTPVTIIMLVVGSLFLSVSANQAVRSTYRRATQSKAMSGAAYASKEKYRLFK